MLSKFFKGGMGKMWQRLGPLFVCFFYHNEIENFLLGLWVKAAFSSAQTKEKAHLNSRKNAFCMPTLSWPRFQSWWKNSLKPTTAELLTRNSDDRSSRTFLHPTTPPLVSDLPHGFRPGWHSLRTERRKPCF